MLWHSMCQCILVRRKLTSNYLHLAEGMFCEPTILPHFPSSFSSFLPSSNPFSPFLHFLLFTTVFFSSVKSILSRLEEVSTCVLHSLPRRNTATLICFAVPTSREGQASVETAVGGSGHLLCKLRRTLPSFCIPDRLVIVEKLPVTSHGGWESECGRVCVCGCEGEGRVQSRQVSFSQCFYSIGTRVVLH